jgi:translation elongation factor EF-G
MKLTLENKWEIYTTEFKNIDVSIEQIIFALQGMLISNGFDKETIVEAFKEFIDNDTTI